MNIRYTMEGYEPENGSIQWYIDSNVIDCDAGEFWKVLERAINQTQIERIYAPFTPDQQKQLNDYQQNSKNRHHRFICAAINCIDGDGEYSVLIARERGWICPCCDYTSNWAYKFMVEQYS